MNIDYNSNQSVKMTMCMCENIFDTKDILSYGDSDRRLVFVDKLFYQCGDWKNKINDYFNNNNIEATIVQVECKEKTKDLESLMFILGYMERFNLLRRSEPVIAIGGGVLMDMVGFASSIFRRGVPYIKVPTTLLGMIDAGLGAKTSINHFDRRNRLGSYFPAILTCIDRQFLKTLPTKEITVAVGELIKIAVIKNAHLFHMFEIDLDPLIKSKFNCKCSSYIIKTAITSMMEELEPNLWEKDLERVVDFGHTFSPIPEMKSLLDNNVPSLHHGEAVALDVLLSSKIAVGRGLLTVEDYNKILNVTKRSGLQVCHPYFKDPYILWDSLLDATRHRNGNQNLPVPIKIGASTFLQDVTIEEIKRVTKW